MKTDLAVGARFLCSPALRGAPRAAAVAGMYPFHAAMA